MMTTETELKAGRVLDALVAEKVMGWTELSGGIGGKASGVDPINNVRTSTPRYSTDIAAAWQVVEKLQSRAHLEQLRGGEFEGRQWWEATFQGHGYAAIQWTSKGDFADTAPLAICLAALKAGRNDNR